MRADGTWAGIKPVYIAPLLSDTSNKADASALAYFLSIFRADRRRRRNTRADKTELPGDDGRRGSPQRMSGRGSKICVSTTSGTASPRDSWSVASTTTASPPYSATPLTGFGHASRITPGYAHVTWAAMVAAVKVLDRPAVQAHVCGSRSGKSLTNALVVRRVG
jgi:hypothetical protein